MFAVVFRVAGTGQTSRMYVGGAALGALGPLWKPPSGADAA